MIVYIRDLGVSKLNKLQEQSLKNDDLNKIT